MATFTKSIVASGDDGTWIPSFPNFNATSVDNVVGAPSIVGGAPTHFFLLITNVTIDQGDTIDAAVINFVASTNASSVNVDALIAASDEDNPTAPTTSADAEALTLTTAQMDWLNIASTTSGAAISSPDITSVIQEIVDRPGWVSGNSILLVVRDNGSTSGEQRNFAAFDHASLAAPELEITYTPAGGGTVALAGTISATSATTGDLAAQAALAGTAVAAAAASADLTARISLSGTAAAQSGATGDLATTAVLSGGAEAQAAGGAGLTLAYRLVGTAAASANLTAALTASARLAGTITASAGSSANLTGGAVEEDLLDGLVSYWELEEASGTRFDAHGTNDLTEVGTVGQNTGIISNAAEYATGDQLTAASTADLQFGDRDWTLSYWFFPTDSGLHFHVAKGDPTGSFREVSAQQSTFDRYQVAVYDGTTATVASLSTGTSAFTLNAWNHVVIWHDDTANEVGFILNGGTPVTATPSGPPGVGSDLFYVGYSVDGRLDEVGRWNRVLTTDERDALWNGGAGLAYASFTESGPGVLRGTVAAQAGASADLSATARLSGTASAPSSASATLTLGQPLSGTAAASSSLSGSLTVTAALSGTAAASARAAAELTLKHSIAGAVSATASTTGALSTRAALAGTLAAAAEASGSLSASAGLAGAAAGAAATLADLRLFQAISGTAAAQAAVSADLAAAARLSGTAAALATLAASLTGGDILLPDRAILVDARAHYRLRDGRTHYQLDDGRDHYTLTSARARYILVDGRPHYLLRRARR